MAISADSILSNKFAKWILVAIVVLFVLGLVRRVF